MDPLLYIDQGLTYHYRRTWGRLMFIWSILFLSLAVTSLILRLPHILLITFEILFLFFLLMYIANAVMKAIFLEIYKERIEKQNGKSYEMLLARDRGRIHKDDVSGFINSPYGDEVLKRLGLRRESLEDYLKKRNYSLRLMENEMREADNLPTYTLALHDYDQHFANFLRNQRVNRDDLKYAAELVQALSSWSMNQDRFWSVKKFHDLSPFEEAIVDVEKIHNLYFTSAVLRQVENLSNEEKLKMVRKIISNAKRQNKRMIYISDLELAKR